MFAVLISALRRRCASTRLSLHGLGMPVFSRRMTVRVGMPLAVTRTAVWLMATLISTLSCVATADAQSAVETDTQNSTGYTVPTTAANLLSTANGATLSASPTTAPNHGDGTNSSWSV